VVVIGGGAAVSAVTAAADPTLPKRTAAQLLVDLEAARFTGFSGTVTQRADLGFPKLPTNGSSDLWSLVTGAHTLRVWYSGPDNVRVALLGTLGETDLIKYNRDLWIWESQKNTATHSVLPAADPSPGPGVPSPAISPLPSSPQDLADLALRAVDPTTVVRTAGSTRVAGRAAYELVLEPRDQTSLIGQVRFAIDAQRHVPLRGQVFAKDSQKSAIEVAFTHVSFTRPDAAQFRFNPPPGAQVVEDGDQPEQAAEPLGQTPAPPVVVGTGWTSVLASRLSPEGLAKLGQGTQGPADRDPSAVAAVESPVIATLLTNLPKVSGTWGSGSLLSTKLFSVLIVDDGRVLVGLVSPERLTQAAADPAAAMKSGA
jgi:outer membrane lipoprotein-sorting protein